MPAPCRYPPFTAWFTRFGVFRLALAPNEVRGAGIAGGVGEALGDELMDHLEGQWTHRHLFSLTSHSLLAGCRLTLLGHS